MVSFRFARARIRSGPDWEGAVRRPVAMLVPAAGTSRVTPTVRNRTGHRPQAYAVVPIDGGMRDRAMLLGWFHGAREGPLVFGFPGG